MTPTKNGDGTLTVPMALSDGDVVGDGVATIGPDDPMYASWLEWIEGSGGSS